MFVARSLAIALWISAAGCNLYFGGSSGGAPSGGDAGAGGDAGGGGGRPPPDAAGDGGSTAIELDLNLGHARPITALHRTATRIASGDDSFHWVLWDVATRTAVASGTPKCGARYSCPADFVTLSNSVLLIRDIDPSLASPNRVEVRSAQTGELRAAIADLTGAGLASDDSYVWTTSSQRLSVFAPDGTRQFTVPGDYSHAQVYAAPDALRLVNGPEPGTLQSINVAGQSMSFTPIHGDFAAWFSDGTALLTKLGATTWVYASDGTQLAIGTLPDLVGLGGVGGYVWQWNPLSFNAALRIYAANDLSAPIQTFLDEDDLFVPSGHSIAHFHAGVLQIISLGSSVTIGPEISLSPRSFNAFGIDLDGDWVVGDGFGLVADDSAVLSQSGDTYSLGQALSLASSSNAQAAIATASGRVMILSIGASSAPIGVVQVPRAQVAMSDDGSLLVAASNLNEIGDEQALQVISTSDGSVLHIWPYPASTSGPSLLGFTLAPKGGVICQLLATCGAGPCSDASRLFTDITGQPQPSYGPALTSGTINTVGPPLPRMSLDGVNALFGPLGPGVTDQAATQLYSNSSLVTAVPGVGLAWLDNDHFIDATYRFQRQNGFETYVQDKVQIYDRAGNVTSTAMLPDVLGTPLVPAGGTLLYWPLSNQVLDYATGAVAWQGDPTVTNAVPVGDYVLYTKNERVLIDRFRH